MSEQTIMGFPTISFNTGRLYQDEGQIIHAAKTNDGVVFNDVSRMVAGFLPSDPELQLIPEFYRFDQEGIMSRYDRTTYEATPQKYWGLEKALGDLGRTL